MTKFELLKLSVGTILVVGILMSLGNSVNSNRPTADVAPAKTPSVIEPVLMAKEPEQIAQLSNPALAPEARSPKVSFVRLEIDSETIFITPELTKQIKVAKGDLVKVIGQVEPASTQVVVTVAGLKSQQYTTTPDDKGNFEVVIGTSFLEVGSHQVKILDQDSFAFQVAPPPVEKFGYGALALGALILGGIWYILHHSERSDFRHRLRHRHLVAAP